jgi:hypothetical protein
LNAILRITITPQPLPPWPCSILNKLLSIRHGNKVNLIRSATQIKAKKTKEEGTSYIHRLCPVMEKLFERERDRERDCMGTKEAFSSTKKRRRPLAFEKKTVALNAMLLCNKLPLSLSLSILPLT